MSFHPSSDRFGISALVKVNHHVRLFEFLGQLHGKSGGTGQPSFCQDKGPIGSQEVLFRPDLVSGRICLIEGIPGVNSPILSFPSLRTTSPTGYTQFQGNVQGRSVNPCLAAGDDSYIQFPRILILFLNSAGLSYFSPCAHMPLWAALASFSALPIAAGGL